MRLLNNKFFYNISYFFRIIVFIIIVSGLYYCTITVKDAHQSAAYIRENNPLKLFNKSRNLKSTPISTFQVGKVFDMFYYEHLLTIRNSNEKFLFTVIDTFTGRFLFNFAREGEGPNEFSSTTKASISNDNKRLCLHDAGRNIYVEYSFKDLLEKKYLSNSTLLNRNFTPNSFNFNRISDSTYLTSGNFRERFILVTDKGGVIQKAITYPFEEIHYNNSYRVLCIAYQGYTLVNQSRKRAVFVTFSSPNLDFLSLDRDKILLLKKYHSSPTDFTGKDGQEIRASTNIDNIFGYVSCTANNNYIYVLYSGKTIRKVGFDNCLTSSIVLVFDWQGNPIIKYDLDVNVNNIAISDDGKNLYVYIDGVHSIFKKITLV